MKQRTDWPGSHSLVAIDPIPSIADRQRCGQESHRGAGIADIEVSVSLRKRTVAADYPRSLRVLICLDGQAQSGERLGHVAGVITEEHARERALPRCQSRDQQ